MGGSRFVTAGLFSGFHEKMHRSIHILPDPEHHRQQFPGAQRGLLSGLSLCVRQYRLDMYRRCYSIFCPEIIFPGKLITPFILMPANNIDSSRSTASTCRRVTVKSQFFFYKADICLDYRQKSSILSFMGYIPRFNPSAVIPSDSGTIENYQKWKDRWE
jgi:hypothetical protein